MTPEEWDVILTLVFQGSSESPWTWSKSWPAGIGGDETREIVTKFERFVEEEKDSYSGPTT